MPSLINLTAIRYFRYLPLLILILLPYTVVIWIFSRTGTEGFEHLHLVLDTSNAILSMLLALFLLAGQCEIRSDIRRYLVIGFGFAAATEILHVLVSIEWSGQLAWIASYSGMLRPATWPPSTYVLPLSLAWAYWLMRRDSTLRAAVFAAGIALLTLGLLVLSLMLPSYVDTGILGIQRPTQLPLLLLWVGVIVLYWSEIRTHPLYEGLALMGILLLLSDIFMLYSTSPHEKFAMMAHAGKLAAYTLMHIVQMRVSAEDSQARTAAEVDLFTEKERLQVTLDSIRDGVIATDSGGRINFMNRVAEALTGWKITEAQGLLLTQVFRAVREHSRQPVLSPVERAMHEGHNVGAAHVILIRRDGAEFFIEDSAAPIYDNEGGIGGAVLVFRDVSFAHQVTAQLSRLSTHDSLTGLINRSEFEKLLKAALNGSGKFHVVLYLDLDQFRIINDACGHIAGDELLRQLSRLMQPALRVGDVLARMGGDEFAVMLKNCPAEQGSRVAEKLRLLVSEFSFEWEKRRFTTGVSIGQVNFSDDNPSYSDVMRAADTACFTAKDKGRNRVQVYKADAKDITLRRGEMAWVRSIQQALDEDRFLLFRQKIDTAHGDDASYAHYEILLRMQDEEGNIVLPMTFIPAAERYGLMPKIDRWVISAMFSRFQSEPPALWSVNLSGTSINDDQFLDFIREQFTIHNVPPQAICFEITETAAISSLSRASHFINDLRTMGCKFSLDDFGSGMSSFGYLKYLQVDYLKIDGSFVMNMVHDPIDRAMVESIHKIGFLMGLQTIAEFVEDEETRKMLEDIGVNYVQGYGVSRPEPF